MRPPLRPLRCRYYRHAFLFLPSLLPAPLLLLHPQRLTLQPEIAVPPFIERHVRRVVDAAVLVLERLDEKVPVYDLMGLAPCNLGAVDIARPPANLIHHPVDADEAGPTDSDAEDAFILLLPPHQNGRSGSLGCCW